MKISKIINCTINKRRTEKQKQKQKQEEKRKGKINNTGLVKVIKTLQNKNIWPTENYEFITVKRRA